MNEKRIWQLAAIIFIFFNVFSLSYIIRLDKSNDLFNQQLKRLDNYLTMKKDENNLLKENYLSSIRYENTKLNKNLIVKKKNELISIKSLAGNSKKMVFRYSALGCQPCVDEQFRLLEEYADGIGRSNILIISSYRDEFAANNFKRINKTSFEIFNLESMEIEIEKYGFPYYFLLLPDMKVSKVFIPVKEIPEMTEKYFELIKEEFRK